MKNKIILLLSLLSCTLLYSTGLTESYNLDFTRQWSNKEFKSIDFDITTATIRVTPSANRDIILKIHGSAPFNKVEDFIEHEVVNNTLKLKQVKRFPKNFNRYDVNIDLYIPEMTFEDFKIDLVTGSIHISQNISCANFETETTTGHINIGNLSANESSVNSITGDINIQSIKGKLKANVVTGDIDVEYDRYSAESIELGATTGHIILRLPENSGFKLNSSTVTGSVECDFPVTISGKLKNNKVSGQVGDPKGDVDISIVTGKIKIKRK